MENENIPLRGYVPGIHLPRSSLKPIEVPLSWNPSPDYHVLDEIKRLEKQDKLMSSLEDELKD